MVGHNLGSCRLHIKGTSSTGEKGPETLAGAIRAHSHGTGEYREEVVDMGLNPGPESFLHPCSWNYFP